MGEPDTESMLVPEGLLYKTECVRHMIEEFITAKIAPNGERCILGHLIVNKEAVLFFSNEVVQEIDVKILRPLIKVHAAKVAAEEEKADDP